MNNINVIEYRRANPELYAQILNIYAPVFDAYVAVYMYENNIPPMVCDICGVRINTSASNLKNTNRRRCRTHAKYNKNKNRTHAELVDIVNASDKILNKPNIMAYSDTKSEESSVGILCAVHGQYQQCIKSLLRGHGCQQCYFDNKRGKLLIEEATYLAKLEEVHGGRYDYSNSVYLGATIKMKIKCHEHGEFSQAPITHRRGHGCPSCANKAATARMATPEDKSLRRSQTTEWIKNNPNARQMNTGIEIKFKDWLTENNIPFEHQYLVECPSTGKWLYDFFIKSMNLLVEVDGEYWHRKPGSYNRDLFKHQIASSGSMTLLRISDDNLDFSSIFLEKDLILEHNLSIMKQRYEYIKETYDSNVRHYTVIQKK